MFWDNITKILAVCSVLAIFCAIFFFLYRKIEGFVDATAEPPTLYKQVEDTIKPITDRLCPIFIGLQTTIAKNAITTVNTNPTEGEAKRASEDAAAGKATPLNEPVPTAQDMQRALERMLLEAQTLLISCPTTNDMTRLPPTIATDIASTLIYLNKKITDMNTQLDSTLNGNLETTNENDADDLYGSMSPAQRANYASILAQYGSNIAPRTVALTSTEIDALLEQRLTTLAILKNQVDPSGNNYVDAYLASMKSGYEKLEKAKNGSVKPGPGMQANMADISTSPDS